MSADIDTPRENKKHRRYKDVCQARNCERRATVQISIKAGAYGLVRLKVCRKCLKLFQSDRSKNTNSDNITRQEAIWLESGLNRSGIMEDNECFHRRRGWHS